MLLNDAQIKNLASNGMIHPYHEGSVKAEPRNGAGGELLVPRPVVSYGMSCHGYDLRLSAEAGLRMILPEEHLSPKEPLTKTSVLELRTDDNGGQYWRLPPNSYALGSIHEKLALPSNIVGLIQGKSTYARIGVGFNCPPVEAGWAGHLTIGIANLSGASVSVYAMEGAIQLMFFSVKLPDADYEAKGGRYQQTSLMIQGPLAGKI